MKGQAAGSETAFILGFIIFIAVIAWFSTQLQDVPGLTFNAAVIVGEFVAIAGACVIVSGLPCAAAIVASSLINLITVPAELSLLFTPLFIVFGYVMARLARGGG